MRFFYGNGRLRTRVATARSKVLAGAYRLYLKFFLLAQGYSLLDFRNSMPLPLESIRIQLAGSIPVSASQANSSGILEFVERFASAVFREGGTLVHGSHPTLLEPLERAARRFIDVGGARGALTLVRSDQFTKTDLNLKSMQTQREFAAVEVIPAPVGDGAASLITMREWISDRCDVVVAIGGKWYEDNPARSGVPLELVEGLNRGIPGFAVAAFGGAIQGYLADNPSIFARLHNGLSENENRRLASEVAIDATVGKIVSQIKLLPLSRKIRATGGLFRILALDGGGIRGAFTAAVLAKWDQMLGPDGGVALVDHFDLVAGTSTGAILAIGLSLRHSPEEILSFYRTEGTRIFPPGGDVRHWIKSKHQSGTLRSSLTTVFGENVLLRDASCRLVIPTVRALHGESELIVTGHSPDRTAFRTITAVDAALASSAAPSYFDEAWINDTIADQCYLDGGLWANNPVLPAIYEAVHHLSIPLNRIDVLSVGTLSSEKNFEAELGKGKLGWAASTSDLFFAAQENAAAMLADGLLTRARHLRVNRMTPTEIPLDNFAAIDELARRGDDVGKDTFEPVRSRFLNGVRALPWRNS
ncbi:CBASS cGAMP-activated phospholipase [Tunturiibacter gelidiferens]|uniref:CBASS cGAMP-activated phospholipase n=1 Tax=Tunturiibacter gelidiferens TaxID=3069689 RepID=A0AAU7YW40_9BACT